MKLICKQCRKPVEIQQYNMRKVISIIEIEDLPDEHPVKVEHNKAVDASAKELSQAIDNDILRALQENPEGIDHG